MAGSPLKTPGTASRARGATILAYHAVGECPHPDREHLCVCVPTDSFARQMALLSRCRRVVRLDDLVEGRVSGRGRLVAITFDDGYRNVLRNAAPVLQHFGFPATVFVPTKWIGKENTWDEGQDCFPLELMSEEDLEEAEARGISVESHGHAHADLSAMGERELDEDLGSSFAILEEILGRAPRHLAYPFGHEISETRSAARRAGYKHAYRFDGLEDGPLAHERVSVDGHEGTFRMRLKTAGGYLARRHSRLGTAAVSVLKPGANRGHHASVR